MCRQSYFCLLNVVDCNARHIFPRGVWYRALSLRYACIRSSGIILTYSQATVVPNFVSVAASIAELDHGEKSRTQSFTQSITQLI